MSSPVINKSTIKKMSFPEAIQALIDGKKITRLDWGDTEEYGLLKDGWLMIHTKGNFHRWVVSDGDLTAFDWIILSESN